MASFITSSSYRRRQRLQHRRSGAVRGLAPVGRRIAGLTVVGAALGMPLSAPLAAQYGPKPPREAQLPVDSLSIWGQGPRLSLGLGQGSEGVALLGVGSLVAGPGDVIVRLSHTGLLERTVGDMAFLYGMRAATPGGRLSGRIGAGLGWVDHAYDGPLYNCRTQDNFAVIVIFPVTWESTDCDQDRIEESGLGLALHLDATVGVSADWGLSVSWFGNVGGPRSYHGFALSFLRTLH